MWRVQLHKINYDEREYQAVKDVLDSGWLAISEKTFNFESAFSDFLGHGAKSLAVSNCTSALHLALLAIGIGKGDEVITPSLTFIADQNAVNMTGAQNILADITSTEDWTMDPDDIERRITSKTKAIMIVHYAGFACDMDRITALCKKHNLLLIEDCAHSPGADYNGRSLGTFGDIAAFSFYANKNIAIGEGGMIVTRNDELLEKCRLLRSHGMTVPSFDRFKGRAATYDVESAGFNYRINEIGSALGFVQLQKLNEANEKRRIIVEQYYSRLDGNPLISIPFRNFKRGKSNYHIMPVLLSEKIDRMAVIESMKQAGIQTSIHYPAIQTFSAYENKVNPTPKAQYICAHELTLPLYPTMTIEEVGAVCEELNKAVKN